MAPLDNFFTGIESTSGALKIMGTLSYINTNQNAGTVTGGTITYRADQLLTAFADSIIDAMLEAKRTNNAAWGSFSNGTC